MTDTTSSATDSIIQVLDAINGALTVIKSLADTPGINILPYASVVSSAISGIQFAYSAGKDVIPYVNAIKDTFSGTAPTADQISALDLKIAELNAAIDAPLPDAEQGEPD